MMIIYFLSILLLMYIIGMCLFFLASRRRYTNISSKLTWILSVVWLPIKLIEWYGYFASKYNLLINILIVFLSDDVKEIEDHNDVFDTLDDNETKLVQ